MKFSSDNFFKFSSWKKIEHKYSTVYERTCLTEESSFFHARIIEKNTNGKIHYDCELPIEMPIKKVNSTKKMYIQDIMTFNDLFEAVLWVDKNLIETLDAEIEKPLIFKWY